MAETGPVGPWGPIASPYNIATWAAQAGFRDDRPSTDPGQRHSELAVAVAIALAESGGRVDAIGPVVRGERAYGLWQIYPGDESLLDPQANANAAWAKYDAAGRSFRPWSVFNSRVYLVRLPAAERAVRETHEAQREGITEPLREWVGDIARDLATFFAWVTSGETWIRLGEVVGGALLLLLALYLLLVKSDTFRSPKGAPT